MPSQGCAPLQDQIGAFLRQQIVPLSAERIATALEKRPQHVRRALQEMIAHKKVRAQLSEDGLTINYAAIPQATVLPMRRKDAYLDALLEEAAVALTRWAAQFSGAADDRPAVEVTLAQAHLARAMETPEQHASTAAEFQAKIKAAQ